MPHFLGKRATQKRQQVVMLGPGMFLHYWNCCFCFWISCYSCSCGCSKFCLFYCFAQLTLSLLQRPVSGTSISFPLLRLYTQSQMYFLFLYSSIFHLYLSASWPCFQNAFFISFTTFNQTNVVSCFFYFKLFPGIVLKSLPLKS